MISQPGEATCGIQFVSRMLGLVTCRTFAADCGRRHRGRLHNSCRYGRNTRRLKGEVAPTCSSGTAKSHDSFPRSRLRLEAGLEPAWSVSQTDCEVPARFAPGRNIQLCHKREHHHRPGATRTRIDGLGHRCPDPLDDEPWRRGGSRTRPAVLRTASRPASPAPCPRADSNGRPRGSEPRALSTAPRGHKGAPGRTRTSVWDA